MTTEEKTTLQILAERYLRLIECIAKLESLIHENHVHQMQQLKAYQLAYNKNCERDEELREALLESSNPWDGC